MRNVLIIDDDAECRALVAEWLRGQGWRVVEADDGESGLELARQHQPEAVICDLLMPRCNGFQVCRALRRNRGEQAFPRIIVTTGSAYATDRLNAFEAGADEYVVKPVAPSELARLLGGNGESKSSAPEPPPAKSDDPAVRVKFWGVRGSLPTPGPDTVFYGGNTACVEVRAGGELIILDAGTGIRGLGRSLAEEFQDRPVSATILISHAHWDHIQGFPFFAPAYDSKNRLQVMGFEGARHGLETTLLSQMESPYFPVSMREMPVNIEIRELRDMKFAIGTIPVEAAFVHHPGVCVGYRLATAGGAVCYIPDVELMPRFRATAGGASKADEAGQKSFVAEQHRKMVEFVRNAEILIIDSQYEIEEYQAHVGWGHSCVEDAVDLAIESGAARLFLFHHDPDHSDEQISRRVARARERAECRGDSILIEAAREGFEVVLQPREANHSSPRSSSPSSSSPR